MRFIECRNETEDYGDLAAALVARADEMGIHPREILTLPTGFSVPDVLAAEFVELRPLPASWSEPLPTVDVVWEQDGTVTLTPEAQERVEAAAVASEPVTRPKPTRRPASRV